MDPSLGGIYFMSICHYDGAELIVAINYCNSIPLTELLGN